MSVLPNSELDRLEELHSKTTGDVWWQKSWITPHPPTSADARELSSLLCHFTDEGEPRVWNYEVDGTFIVAAHEMVPRLIAEIRKLREQLNS